MGSRCRIRNHRVINCALIIVVATVISSESSISHRLFAAATDEDAKPAVVRSLCDQSVLSYRLLTPQHSENVEEDAGEPQRNCICKMAHQAPWGDPKIQIDCTAMDLTDELLLAPHLPFGTQIIDLSWNVLQKLPKVDSNLDQLQIFRAHNNHIEKLEYDDLVGLGALQELDVSNNVIESLELGAFRDLTHLKKLNLAYNSLRTLAESIFRPLKSLVHLTLSGNDLNDLFVEKNLFYNLKANAETLEVLELEYCHLTWLSVETAVGLKELRLRGNAFFKQMPLLAPNIQLLDLSGNPVRRLDTVYDGQLRKMETMLLEDMPNFYMLGVSSLASFRSLRKISLQNSKNFTYFSELAFDGAEAAFEDESDSKVFEKLNEIILTGTNVRKLSEKLQEYLPQVEVIALDGCPMQCDCDLKWLMGRRAGITTGGICEKPLSTKDLRIDEIQPENIKNCSDFSRFMFKIMNVLLILFMIILCSVGMYFLVMGCRPSKKFYIRQRMALNSPYSRITVEPIGQSYRPSTISQA